MSRDSEGLAWCDMCWDNPATMTATDNDGDRVDLCGECHNGLAAETAIIEFTPIGDNAR